MKIFVRFIIKQSLNKMPNLIPKEKEQLAKLTLQFINTLNNDTVVNELGT